MCILLPIVACVLLSLGQGYLCILYDSTYCFVSYLVYIASLIFYLCCHMSPVGPAETLEPALDTKLGPEGDLRYFKRGQKVKEKLTIGYQA